MKSDINEKKRVWFMKEPIKWKKYENEKVGYGVIT
jgi:hypothetical protein